ncbi:hypothetical protein MMC19_006924 [Ptychographa xylographoides]|nr:hypothetical protein [Ptychographa xylographoides]
MWRDPVEVPTKSAIKVDPSAPARSTIRRQPTVRHRSRSSRQRAQGVPPGLDRRALLDIIRRDREEAIAAAEERGDLGETLADIARLEASNRRRSESGRALLRDALSYEQPGLRMRQIRESALRYEVPPPGPAMPDHRDSSRDEAATWSQFGTSSRTVENRSPPPRYMPTPPHASLDTNTPTRHETPSTSSPYQSQSRPARDLPSLTPRFAPAFRIDDDVESYDTAAQAFERSRLIGIRDSHPDGPLNTYGHPPLRRNRHRPAHETPEEQPPGIAIDRADGLGDRRRSFSPEDNTWETLLTTITPDERLPSADSSFTSATASASSLSSNSASSSATLLTAPSMRSDSGYGLSNPSNICDDLTDSECSMTDDDVGTSTHHEYQDDPPRQGAHLYSSNIRATPRRAWEINDQATMLRRRTSQDIEYQRMQIMMASMDRNHPVPAEWWATAGLSRTSSGRADRTERERL